MTLLIAASLATLWLQTVSDWETARIAYYVIDITVTGAAMYLALTLERYWPIWFAGFQVATICTDAASILAPAPWPGIYGTIASFWAVPQLIAIAVGMLRDRRGCRHQTEYI